MALNESKREGEPSVSRKEFFSGLKGALPSLDKEDSDAEKRRRGETVKICKSGVSREQKKEQR